MGAKKDFLFAEDEVLQVWADAENLVESDLEELVHAELTQQWKHERLHRRWKERTLIEVETIAPSNISKSYFLHAIHTHSSPSNSYSHT